MRYSRKVALRIFEMYWEIMKISRVGVASILKFRVNVAGRFRVSRNNTAQDKWDL